eukprot:CAMPEP_0173467600 /NCGR_PEP_ID=MMETSP1357-20121228/75359_1 /TAXON_ID=77926 /ORGANISM="Hemiselmis rufescens, Strain PCC563" /LENGTH=494 /DNA_ID=CAMNT_0014435751 /DNA_START=45 /DNA_END=1526 /DNA_ORIENTATION=-
MAHIAAMARSSSRRRCDSISSSAALSMDSFEVQKVRSQFEEALSKNNNLPSHLKIPNPPNPPHGYKEDPCKEEKEMLVKTMKTDKDDRRELTKWFDLACTLWDFLEDPNSSPAALAWAITVMGLIMLSCSCFVVETMPELCCGRFDHVWNPIETICIAAFTFEYVSRFLLCPIDYGTEGNLHLMQQASRVYAQMEPMWADHFRSRLRFIWSPLNVVDVVAILPFYIDILIAGSGGNLQFVRVIRLARVFRLFKLGKYSGGLQLLAKTMAKSMRSLLMMCGMLAVVIILFSTFMYYLERGRFCDPSNDFCEGSATLGVGWYANPYEYTLSHYESELCPNSWCRDISDFQSIFISGYWVLATMTTTGYGALYPQTAPALMLGCVVMFSGLLLLALPITIISGNFIHLFQAGNYEKNLRKWKEDVELLTNPPDDSKGKGGGAKGESEEDGEKKGKQNSFLKRQLNWIMSYSVEEEPESPASGEDASTPGNSSSSANA